MTISGATVWDLVSLWPPSWSVLGSEDSCVQIIGTAKWGPHVPNPMAPPSAPPLTLPQPHGPALASPPPFTAPPLTRPDPPQPRPSTPLTLHPHPLHALTPQPRPGTHSPAAASWPGTPAGAASSSHPREVLASQVCRHR